MTDFWSRALASPEQAPESKPSADDVTLADWADNRSALGIPDTGDFVGLRGWTRESAVRHVPRESTWLEQYAAEREKLGIRDAPQSSAAKHLRETQGAWRALNDNNPRRSK